MQQDDWLFAIPRAGGAKEQERVLAEWLAADPAAAAISDAEVELFCAVASLLRTLNTDDFTRLCRDVGVSVYHASPKGRRRATFKILAKWKEPGARKWLVDLLPKCPMGSLPDAATRAHLFTDERFAKAFGERLDYRMWLRIGRLTLRRVVYPEAEPARALLEVAAAAQPALTDELLAKDRQSGALRHDVRRLQQDRRQLKERARRAEQEARAQLSQARGEVEAARRALQAQLTRQEQELAAQARKHEGELAPLQARRIGAREVFAHTLARLAASGPVDLLHGREIAVDGPEADQAIHRLLVESLGGRLVPDGNGTVIRARAGFAAFDRQLRHLALDRVLIKCDGLYRRKAGRAGIAISAFQVQTGDSAGFRSSSVVCCGPAAGSLMAEYGAVAMALSWLVAGDPPPGAKLEIWSDCKTMLSRIRRPVPTQRTLGCVTLDKAIRRLIRTLHRRGCEVHLRWVPRAEVDAVDRLCDQAYRAQLWYHKPSRTRKPHAPLRGFLERVAASAPSRAGTATVRVRPASPTGVTAAPAPILQMRDLL